jgi:hypothetical protein
VVLLALALVLLSLADVLLLKDGRRIEGRIVAEDASSVTLETIIGRQTFARSEIASISTTRTPKEEFEERKAACKTADDHYQLGRWCLVNKMRKQAPVLFARAIELDSDHEGARAELGFVRYKDEWLTPEQRARRARADLEAEMRAKGLVPHGDLWVTPEDKARLDLGLVLHEGEWLPRAEALARQGLCEYQGAVLPMFEAQARRRHAAAAAAARTPLVLRIGTEFALSGNLSPALFQTIEQGLAQGRAWFERALAAPSGRALWTGHLAHLFVFEDDAAYEASLPVLLADAQWVPEGFVASARGIHGFTWIDPFAIASARRGGRDDLDLVGQCYHQLGHLMVDRLGYQGRLLPPWYEEGLACLVEDRVHQKNLVLCRAPAVVAIGAGTGSKGGLVFELDAATLRAGSWRVELRAALRSGSIPPFDRLAAREFHQLEAADLAVAMAILEWLEGQGPRALADFHATLRARMPAAPQRVVATAGERKQFYDAAFRAALGLDTSGADRAWRAWQSSR